MPKRSRKQTYSKKYIDAIFYKLSLGCEVLSTKLSAKNIENQKLSLITNKENTTKEELNISKNDKASKENTSEPLRKIPKLDTDERDALKLVLSREGETHQFKSQFKSLLTPNNEIPSTSTDYAPVVIDCEESAKSANSSVKNDDESIWIIDVKEMMEEDNYKKWMKMAHSDKNSKNRRSCTKKLAVAKLPIGGPKKKKITLNEVEKLYKKYFTKYVQDTIVIISNLLVVISVASRHQKSRMGETSTKRTEANQCFDIYSANLTHLNYKDIFSQIFRKNFTDVVTSFSELDFDSAFHLLFLGILSVIRILEHENFKKGGLFKNVVLILYNTLKDTGYKSSKVFSMLSSKTFRAESIHLISTIENGQENDKSVINRLGFFFITSLKKHALFDDTFHIAASDVNNNLVSLIENAALKYRQNSPFRDPVDSSTVQHLIAEVPISTIHKNCDSIIEHTHTRKNPDGTYQQIHFRNDNKYQYTGNTAEEKSNVMSQPLNNSYQPISSSVQKKTYEPSISKAMPENSCFVVAPTVSYGSLGQVIASTSGTLSSSGTATSIPTATSLRSKSLVQNNKSVTNSLPLIETDGETSSSGTAASIPITTYLTSKSLIQNNKSVTNSPLIETDGETSSSGTAASVPITTTVTTKSLIQNNKSVTNSPLIKTDGETSSSGTAASIPITKSLTTKSLIQNKKSVTNSPLIKTDGETSSSGTAASIPITTSLTTKSLIQNKKSVTNSPLLNTDRETSSSGTAASIPITTSLTTKSLIQNKKSVTNSPLIKTDGETSSSGTAASIPITTSLTTKSLIQNNKSVTNSPLLNTDRETSSSGTAASIPITTSLTTKSLIQNKKSVTNSPLIKTDGETSSSGTAASIPITTSLTTKSLIQNKKSVTNSPLIKTDGETSSSGTAASIPITTSLTTKSLIQNNKSVTNSPLLKTDGETSSSGTAASIPITTSLTTKSLIQNNKSVTNSPLIKTDGETSSSGTAASIPITTSLTTKSLIQNNKSVTTSPLIKTDRETSSSGTAASIPITTSLTTKSLIQNNKSVTNSPLIKTDGETSSSGTAASVPITTTVTLKPLVQNNKSVTNSPLIKTDGETSSSGTAASIPITTSLTTKSLIQNNKSVTNSPLIKTDGGTFKHGNKQYRFVKSSMLSGPIRGIINGTNNISVIPPQTSYIKCNARNCFNPARIMCSACHTVKYCNEICQGNDWRDGHINNCKRLQNERNQP